MSEREIQKKVNLREITEAIGVEIFRFMTAFEDIDEKVGEEKRRKLRNLFKRLESIKDHLWGLADNFITGEASQEEKALKGEAYVGKLIRLCRDLSNDDELWDSLPKNIRTYESSPLDIKRDKELVKNWGDSTSKDYMDNFTHIRTGELVVTREEIQELILKKERFIHDETIGRPKAEVRELFRGHVSDLEEFYLAAPSSFSKELH